MWRSEGIATLILNLGVKWRGFFNITPRPLYLHERSMVLLQQEAGWAPGTVRAFWGRRKFLFPARSTCRLVPIPTELSWF